MSDDFRLIPLRRCLAGFLPYRGREVSLRMHSTGVRGPLSFDGLYRVGGAAVSCYLLFSGAVFTDTEEPVADRFYPDMDGCRVYGSYGTLTLDGAGFVTAYDPDIEGDGGSYWDIVRFDIVAMFGYTTPGEPVSAFDILLCPYWTDLGVYEPAAETEGDAL